MAFSVELIKLRVATAEGEFGTRLELKPGLNIVRAENTSGKSTCVMAMVYALGLEGAFSAQPGPPLPPSVTTELEHRGRKIGVTESSVEVGLVNNKGKRILVKRSIKSRSGDNRLVTVQEDGGAPMDFFVNIEGSAQRERGFHAFLAKYIGWELPLVPKYDADDVPLYIECLAPFFIVEQKSGWSQIEPKLPTRFGIRDMHARAVEFILDLDIQKHAKTRAEIRIRREQLTETWRVLFQALSERARRLGGALSGYPSQPSGLWPPSPSPSIGFERDNAVTTLDAEREDLAARLRSVSTTPVPSAGETSEEAKEQLGEAELRFADISMMYQEAFNDYETERALNRSMDLRLEQLDEDLRKYKDIERLKKFGSTQTNTSWNGICPTCSQPIRDELLAQEHDHDTMSVDQNIEFIEAQIGAYKATKSASDTALQKKASQKEQILAAANDLRGRIRALKETLVSASSAPSVASVRERILLENRQLELEELARHASSANENFESLSREWNGLQALAADSSGKASKSDKSKISKWTASIREQLHNYGFKSIDALGIDVSWGSFRLEFEGSAFEKGISASDMIRCHWAYLLGLLAVAKEAKTNHPLVLVFDEPRQQSAAESSLAALLRYSVTAVQGSKQMILATSEKAEVLHQMLRGIDSHVLDFGLEKILRPV